MKNHHGHFIVWSALAVLLLEGVVAWISSERTNTFSFHAFAVLRSDFEHSLKMTLDDAILNRYACKRFRRYSNTSSVDMVDGAVHRASSSDPSVVQRALQCLDLARRTPTAFNTQPYKVVLVHTPEQKEKLSRFCLGPNGARVRDSDCTAVFLADKQVTRTFPRFRQLLQRIGETKSRRPLKRLALLKMQFYITLFSSGLPMHRCLAAPISFLVRTGMSLVNLFTKWFYPMPTLASAETWSSKQVMMVAMTFMLACTSRGLVTIPMEGINAGGIRKVIKVPSRYAIPLIVSAGLPYSDEGARSIRSHDIISTSILDDRYQMNELFYGDALGAPLPKFDEPQGFAAEKIQ